MKRVVIAFLALGFVLVSCAEPATQDDCKQMCENLVKLRGKLEKLSEKDLVAKATEEYKQKEERLQAWMDRDLKGWDEELNKKLEEAKSDAEKETLKEDYEKKKEVTRQKHLPGIEELKPERETAIKEAKQRAQDTLSEWNAAIDECVASALKEGTSKMQAQCKINATSTDEYWNKCR